MKIGAADAINSSSAVLSAPSRVAAASLRNGVCVAAAVAVVVVAPAALAVAVAAEAGDSNRVAATATAALGSRLARGASPAEERAPQRPTLRELMAF